MLDNEELSVMFLQLRISERSGRGVPKVVETYGKDAYRFTEKTITVTIPFNRIDVIESIDRSQNVARRLNST